MPSLPGQISLDEDGIDILLTMGEGAQALKRLGVDAGNIGGFCISVQKFSCKGLAPYLLFVQASVAKADKRIIGHRGVQ